MDSPLPSSIASYLQEAGFSGTEIVVIRTLLEGSALTLRELSAKSGKSTGVLDQAVKKLLKKGLITREVINNTPRYALTSLQTIVDWMQEDVALKQEMLVRRHQNFESFVRSLTVSVRKRPEMEFFEGSDAVQRAYLHMLERGNDLIQYGPVWGEVPGFPPSFWDEYARERRRRGIFARVITNDTPEGRRFRSRDPFEYRKTVLADRRDFPFPFEKITIGDTLACFQLEDARACFIRYPELAQDERIFFERIWNRQVQQQPGPEGEKGARAPYVREEIIDVGPSRQELWQHLKRFFWGRSSLLSFLFFGACAALLTYGLYRRDLGERTALMQERIRSIAATAAPLFDVDDLNAIHTLQDAQKPQYAKLVTQLNLIRDQNPGVKYAYLMRPSEGTIWEFIADADAMDPWQETDRNGDGVIEPEEIPTYPGLKYETYDMFSTNDEPFHVVLEKPVAQDPFVDQWGYLISGLAPIKDIHGNTAGIIGIDVAMDTVMGEGLVLLPNVLSFFGFLLVLLVVRLIAFHRTLAEELLSRMRLRRFSVLAVTVGLGAIALSVSLYLYDVRQAIEHKRERAMSIAANAALQFDAVDIQEVHVPSDIRKPAYEQLVRQLNLIRNQNAGVIRYAYIMRATDNPQYWAFVADADALYPDVAQDLNGDGIVTGADHIIMPGELYDISQQDIRDAFIRPTADIAPVTDQWGTWISGSAPIRDEQGNTVALFAVDLDAKGIRALHLRIFAPLLIYIILMISVGMGHYSLYNSNGVNMAEKNIERFEFRKATVFVSIAAVIAIALTTALYLYDVRMSIKGIQERITSIAITAAMQFTPQELDQLHTRKDIQKAEYTSIVERLYNIRTQNMEIMYVYLIRPFEGTTTFEFIADADAFGMDFNSIGDTNKDGIIDSSDEFGYPGLPYDISHIRELREREYLLPIATDRPYTDKWGTILSGYAPIKRENGQIAGLLAVDVDAQDIYDLRKRTFAPFVIFTLLFFGSLITQSKTFKILANIPLLRGSK